MSRKAVTQDEFIDMSRAGLISDAYLTTRCADGIFIRGYHASGTEIHAALRNNYQTQLNTEK